MQNLMKGRVVTITGANSGIGKAIAEKLGAMGLKVVLGARRKEELILVTESIRKSGGDAVFAVVDVSNKSDLAELVGLAVNTYGRLDIIVNNAGVTQLSRIDALDTDG